VTPQQKKENGGRFNNELTRARFRDACGGAFDFGLCQPALYEF
jgi:hypothetical protein